MDTKSRVIRVGLTGGIASGKTLVADEFARLGIPIIDTDEISRAVVEPGQPALEEITAVFGQDVLTDSGELDRQQLRSIVFADEKLRQQLETILHPRIREQTLKASETAGGPYQVIVVPLLFEAGFQSLVERVLVVDCPESLQRKRLIDRDNEEPNLADRVIAAQLTRSARLEAADDIIDNAGTIAETRRQVEKLHRQYLSLADLAAR